ncbi:MAG: LysM peptidoglycan-binding domain-containing protein [Lachnospiraceae bacterium]|nr:LysM peptidoglycan-binding domain-containing protein [Lachnospiraceae bacterium]
MESSSQPYITYVMQPGDTLDGLAERFGINVRTLETLNDLPPKSTLCTKQTIRIPESADKPSFFF